MKDTRSKADILRENTELRKRLAELEATAQPIHPETGVLPYEPRDIRQILGSLPIGVIVVNADGFFANGAVRDITGYDPVEIPTKKDWYDKIFVVDPERLRVMDMEDRASHHPIPRIIPIRRKDGVIRQVEFSRNSLGDMHVYTLRDMTDTVEREKASAIDNRRLEAIDRLRGMHAVSVDEVCRFSIEEGIALTGSELGYLAFTNGDETELSMYAWSESAMDQCGVKNRRILYHVADTGLWGEAIRQRRPIITNDYAAPNEWKKGIPEGHVPILRHMNVPVFDGAHIVAVAGVANKAEPYDDTDVVQLSLLMDGMWAHVRRLRAAEALRENEEKYRSLFESAGEGILILDGRRIIDCNRAAEVMFGIGLDKLVGSDVVMLSPSRQPDGSESVVVADDYIRRVHEGEAVSFEWVHMRADGSFFFTEVSLSPLNLTSGVRVLAFIRDVSTRKTAEEALLRSERELESIIRNTPDIIYRLDTEGIVTFINDAVSQYGYTPEEIVGTSIFDYVHPEDRDRIKHYLNERRTGERSTKNFEVKLFSSERDVRHFHNKSVPLSEEPVFLLQAEGLYAAPRPTGNTWIGTQGVARDITDRKKAEEALRKSEERYRTIVETTTEWIWRMDLEGNHTYSNGRIESILGYTPEEMVGGNAILHLHEDDRREVEAKLPKLIADARGWRGWVLRWRHKDGTFRHLESNASPMMNTTGECVGYLGIDRDVTDRIAVEEALRDSEERFRSMIQSSSDMIFILDKDAIFTYESPSVSRILGYPEGFTIGRNPLDFVHPDDVETIGKELHEVFGSVNSGKPTEFRAKHAGGEWIYLDALGSNQFDNPAIRGVVLTVRNITGRKKYEKDILESRMMLRTVLDTIPARVFWKDRDLRFLGCNRAFAEDAGLDVPEMLIGKTDYDMVWKDQADMYRADDRRVMDSGIPKLDYEESQSSLEGGIHWLKTSKIPLVDAEGNITGILGTYEEITARKQAEEALKQSEERFSKAFQSSPVAIAITRLSDGTFFDVNDASIITLGYTREEMVGRSTSELGIWVEPGFRDMLVGTLSSGGSLRDRECLLRRKNGDIGTARYSAELIEIGGEQCVLSVIMNITEQKKAEDALRESENRFRQLLENIREIVWLREKETGRILYVNPSLENITGFTADEFLNDMDKFLGAIEPEDRDKFISALERLYQEGEILDEECRFKRSDGNRIWIWLRAYPIRDESGNVIRFAGVAEDITARKESEEAIRQSERLLSTYFDLPLVGRVILSNRGKMIRVNDRFCETVGYDRADIAHLKWTDITPFEDLFVLLEFYKNVKRGKVDGIDRETSVIRKDGRTMTVSLSLRAVRKPDGTVDYYVIDIQDITDRKRLEAQFAQSQKMESVGRLAGGVAHDFNNILTVINMTAEMGLMSLEPGDPHYDEFEHIRKSGERAADLTRKLLAFSRKQIVAPMVINLNDVLLDMNKMFRRLIGEDIELVTIPGEAIPNVRIDPGQMEQVLTNLVVNARDAMPSGGKITIETQPVVVDSEYAGAHLGAAPGEYVMVSVSDTGMGMTEEVRSHLFEPFFTTKEHGKGTGLGLSTCYGIVKQNGGHIWVYSEPGKGSAFKIYLPAVREPGEVTGKPVEEKLTRGGGETILLVEDDPGIRRVAERILRTSGYDVIAASNGEEALSVAANHDGVIGLLLTDVVMPLMSGRELADRFAVIMPDLKVLFMSGYTDDAIVHHGVLDEGVSFIQKPFSAASLLKKVREVMDGIG